MWGFIKTMVQTLISPLIILYLKTKVIKTEDDQGRYDLIAGIAMEAATDAVRRLLSMPLPPQRRQRIPGSGCRAACG